jgi:hyaluronoglucosaminidase
MQQSPFQVRGVVEGFYGPFYTFPERNDLIRFIGQHGYNLYIYGPKNDRQHRSRWWEPYPAAIIGQFAETVQIAESVGVQFCYAISPISYAPDKDFEKLTTKVHSLYDCGVRAFSVFMDDIVCAAHGKMKCALCPSPADAHIDICNRLYEWLGSLGAACTLSMCPTDYDGQAPFGAYLHDLGARLDPEIDILYTGPDVCSPEIKTSDARDFAQAVRRAPLIWDNYPVNDLHMRSSMHIGPIRGREATLYEAVRGVVVNPMLQAEASKIALLTFADYFRDPHGYDPWRSWERALREIGGAASYAALRQFAENSLDSCLKRAEASTLARLTNGAMAALEQGEQPSSSAALQALNDYLHRLDESCYELKHRMPNLRLRDDLLPWIEALEDWLWLGKRAVVILKLMESGGSYEWPVREMERLLDEIGRHTKRVGGSVLLPLASYVLEQAEQHRTHQAAFGDQAPSALGVDNYPSSMSTC